MNLINVGRLFTKIAVIKGCTHPWRPGCTSGRALQLEETLRAATPVGVHCWPRLCMRSDVCPRFWRVDVAKSSSANKNVKILFHVFWKTANENLTCLLTGLGLDSSAWWTGVQLGSGQQSYNADFSSSAHSSHQNQIGRSHTRENRAP